MKFFSASLLTLAVAASLVAAQAKQGERCQPSARLICAKGLTCWTGDKKIVGAPGICVQYVDVGGKCGGATLGANRCKAGFTCYKAVTRPGASGECRPLSKAGGNCDGSVRFPPVCDKGLKCNPPAVMMPGAFGTCVKA